MPRTLPRIAPQRLAIEECCLTKLDTRFVIVVQFILAILSFNLLGAFNLAFGGLSLGALALVFFMIRGQVWAYGLAKILALVFLIIYSVDLLGLLSLSHEVSFTLRLSEGLGIWLSGMVVANLLPVSMREAFRLG